MTTQSDYDNIYTTYQFLLDNENDGQRHACIVKRINYKTFSPSGLLYFTVTGLLTAGLTAFITLLFPENRQSSIFPILLLILEMLALYIVFRKRRKTEKDARKHVAEDYAEKIMIEERTQKRNNWLSTCSYVPRKYWNYSVLGTLLDYMQTNRAETLGDALNLYEYESRLERHHAEQMEAFERHERMEERRHRDVVVGLVGIGDNQRIINNNLNELNRRLR